jgi:hypothetical protein
METFSTIGRGKKAHPIDFETLPQIALVSKDTLGCDEKIIQA